MCLLNGLPKPAGGEMHFTPVALGLVVAQPVLQERGTTALALTMHKPLERKRNSLERSGAQSIETETLASMYDSKFPRQS